jgi:hypothetical protein
MSLIGLLIVLLVACVIIWAAKSLMVAFGVGDPIRTVIYVILVIVVLVWILNSVGYVSLGSIRLR